MGNPEPGQFSDFPALADLEFNKAGKAANNTHLKAGLQSSIFNLVGKGQDQVGLAGE